MRTDADSMRRRIVEVKKTSLIRQSIIRMAPQRGETSRQEAGEGSNGIFEEEEDHGSNVEEVRSPGPTESEERAAEANEIR